ncbi:hypothetical protein KQI65_09430 [bacterium]|nr:hypothetical protein [bacterium]
MKKLFLLTAFVLFVSSPLQSSAQSTILELQTVTASSSKWEVKAIMKPAMTIMNIEAVSVALSYNPSELGMDPTNPITNKHFQSSGFDDGSIPDWDSNGINPDVTLYSEYHPTFGSAPILKNNPPTLCHFNFVPKTSPPPPISVCVWGNTSTGALTYFFEAGVAQQQNFDAQPQCLTWVPVELTSFTAAQQGEAVALKWVTASETNNYGFHIERLDPISEGPSEWKTVGFVKGAGTTYAQRQYLALNNDLPGDGIYKYRLRQEDFDGTTEYSPEAIVNFSLRPNAYALHQNYPNPLSLSLGNGTTVGYDVAEDSNVRISVSNLLGQEIATLLDEHRAAGSYAVNWQPLHIAAGSYIVTMIAENAASGSAEIRHLRMQVVR